MPEMQQEIYDHPQHQRARCWEGKMPKMRGEKIRTAHNRFPGKNLKKKLIFETNFKCQGSNVN